MATCPGRDGGLPDRPRHTWRRYAFGRFEDLCQLGPVRDSWMAMLSTARRQGSPKRRREGGVKASRWASARPGFRSVVGRRSRRCGRRHRRQAARLEASVSGVREWNPREVRNVVASAAVVRPSFRGRIMGRRLGRPAESCRPGRSSTVHIGLRAHESPPPPSPRRRGVEKTDNSS
jgi:hypothetical protein